MTDVDLSGFLSDLSAPTGAPGGGAASGMAGSFGCALFEMVAGVTITLPRFTEGKDQLAKIKKEASKLREQLVSLSQEDAEAYKTVERAMKMPRASADEKALRRTAMQEAFKEATIVPLKTVEACVSALSLLPDLLKYGNPNAITDVAVGGLLLDAARKGAAMNAEINITSIKDKKFTDKAVEKLAEFREKAQEGVQLLAQAVKEAGLTF